MLDCKSTVVSSLGTDYIKSSIVDVGPQSWNISKADFHEHGCIRRQGICS